MILTRADIEFKDAVGSLQLGEMHQYLFFIYSCDFLYIEAKLSLRYCNVIQLHFLTDIELIFTGYIFVYIITDRVSQSNKSNTIENANIRTVVFWCVAAINGTKLCVFYDLLHCVWPLLGEFTLGPGHSWVSLHWDLASHG